MKINVINQQNMNNNSKIGFGHKKIPRYIYHFTRRNYYECMLMDGVLRGSRKDGFIKEKAIFAVDLQNFCKNWGYNKSWNNVIFPDPLYQSLLDKVASNFNNFDEWFNKFVVLKIPTKNLDIDKLRIRSQKIFFEEIMNVSDTETNSNIRAHLEGQTPATESRRYNNRKEAFEYVYLGDIPIDKVEVLNDITPLQKSIEFNKKNKYLNLLMNLFNKTPQINEIKKISG